MHGNHLRQHVKELLPGPWIPSPAAASGPQGSRAPLDDFQGSLNMFNRQLPPGAAAGPAGIWESPMRFPARPEQLLRAPKGHSGARLNSKISHTHSTHIFTHIPHVLLFLLRKAPCDRRSSTPQALGFSLSNTTAFASGHTSAPLIMYPGKHPASPLTIAQLVRTHQRAPDHVARHTKTSIKGRRPRAKPKRIMK